MAVPLDPRNLDAAPYLARKGYSVCIQRSEASYWPCHGCVICHIDSHVTIHIIIPTLDVEYFQSDPTVLYKEASWSRQSEPTITSKIPIRCDPCSFVERLKFPSGRIYLPVPRYTRLKITKVGGKSQFERTSCHQLDPATTIQLKDYFLDYMDTTQTEGNQ